jgi:hypothetical protein
MDKNASKKDRRDLAPSPVVSLILFQLSAKQIKEIFNPSQRRAHFVAAGDRAARKPEHSDDPHLIRRAPTISGRLLLAMQAPRRCTRTMEVHRRAMTSGRDGHLHAERRAASGYTFLSAKDC